MTSQQGNHPQEDFLAADKYSTNTSIQLNSHRESTQSKLIGNDKQQPLLENNEQIMAKISHHERV